MTTNFNNLLNDIYYDSKNPGSLGGINKLYLQAKSYEPGIKYKDVLNWLRSQNVYTLHRPARRRFKRNRIIVSHINEQWEIDLVDLKLFSQQNHGYNYLLVIIDAFSKFLRVFPLKTKSAVEVLSKFKTLFQTVKPKKIRSDKGGEFDNRIFRKYCEQNNVIYFTTENKDIKCAIVERVNRTLKEKMFRYFTQKGTRNYIDVLQNFVDSYNNSKHRSIKMAPADVDPEDEKIVFENLYNHPNMKSLIFNQKKLKPKLKIGDTVRQKYTLNALDKSYYPLWTDMVYKIDKVYNKHTKPQYTLEVEGEKFKRRFYPEELQKVHVDADTLWLIEKEIAHRTLNGEKQALVKWKGYPNKYNQWIPIDQIRNL